MIYYIFYCFLCLCAPQTVHTAHGKRKIDRTAFVQCSEKESDKKRKVEDDEEMMGPSMPTHKTTPAIITNPQRKTILLATLSSLPSVLITMVAEYAENRDEYFIPISSRRLHGLQYTSPEQEPFLHIFGLDPSGLLRCNEFRLEQADKTVDGGSAEALTHPLSWDKDQQQFMHNIITARYGTRNIRQIPHSRVGFCYDHVGDYHVCGVSYYVLKDLTTLISMQNEMVRTDSEAYRNGCSRSLMMLDPTSLTVHDFAEQMETIYAKLKKANKRGTVDTLYPAERKLVKAFMRAYRDSQVVHRLKNINPGRTSLLFYD